MTQDKVVLPTGEKGGPVVTTDSELADPSNQKLAKGTRLDASGRPMYEWEVDPAKQVGAAAQQQSEPKRVKSTSRRSGKSSK